MSVDVSVVIPTRNRREYLERAVASCFDDIGSVSVEVVVVDDGSTDGTREWLEGLGDPRVNAHFPGQQGPQQARNRGLDLVTGRYVKFLDDDDWLVPGALRTEVQTLMDSGVDLVAGDALVWEDDKVVQHLPAPRGPDPFLDVASGDATTHPFKYTMTRELAAANPWDPGIGIRTDLDFMLRVSRAASSYARVDGNAGYFRIHEGPRMSAPKRDVRGAVMHLSLLCQTAEALLEDGTTGARAEAVQLGLWRYLHLLYPVDRPSALRAWDLVRRLDAESPFMPPRPSRVLRSMDRLIGPMGVEEVGRLPRQIKRWLAS